MRCLYKLGEYFWMIALALMKVALMVLKSLNFLLLIIFIALFGGGFGMIKVLLE